MTVAQFFGCGLIAFGPPLAMFIVTIAKDPIRAIMLVASSFFWLISMLISSMLYKAVIPLQPYLAFGALFSVLFQEFFRFLWLTVIKRAETGLKKVSEDDIEVIENKHILAYVSGLGFGLISGALALVNVLADVTGPGTVGLYGDSPYFFVATTFSGLAFILLHVCWSLIFFDSVHHRKWFGLCFVILTHLAATGITLANPFYAVTVPLLWVLLCVVAVYALRVVGMTANSIKRTFKPVDRSYNVDVAASADDL